MSRFIPTLTCMALALVVLFATACQPNLENNAQFQDKVAFIDRLDDQMKNIDQRVNRNGSFLKQIVDDIKKIKAESQGGSSDVVAALDQRIQRLENSLKTSNDTIVSLETRLKETTAAQNKLAGAIKTAARSTASKTVALSPAKKGATRSASATKPKPRTTGKYHMVKSGETAESIAKSYKIPASTLLVANRLPSGTKLMAGQQVFVPAMN